MTGWPSVLTNVGVNESIWLSTDLGGTWSNVFGNLAAATSAAGPVRFQGGCSSSRLAATRRCLPARSTASS